MKVITNNLSDGDSVFWTKFTGKMLFQWSILTNVYIYYYYSLESYNINIFNIAFRTTDWLCVSPRIRLLHCECWNGGRRIKSYLMAFFIILSLLNLLTPFTYGYKVFLRIPLKQQDNSASPVFFLKAAFDLGCLKISEPYTTTYTVLSISTDNTHYRSLGICSGDRTNVNGVIPKKSQLKGRG